MSNPTPAHRRLPALAVAMCFVIVGMVLPLTGVAQMPDGLPFYAGERLTYGVTLARLGRKGSAVMTMDGPVDVRGTSVYAVRFDFRAAVGPVKARDRTGSWIDLDRMASVRFFKEERNPFARHDEAVELFLDRGRWEAADGTSGNIAAVAPLDELSFMYFIRTLTLAPDSVYRFDRHFDARRNPTTLRVVKSDTIDTRAGRFATILIEMRVRDSRRYDGEGVIRIHLSDDDLRIPVRIESAMPVVGNAVLTLESHTRPHVLIGVDKVAIAPPSRE